MRLSSQAAPGGNTGLRPDCNLKLDLLKGSGRSLFCFWFGFFSLWVRGLLAPLFFTVFNRRTGFLVVVTHSVGKGATRPLDKVLFDFSRAINPSPYSLLAQRIGEERHSLRRREWLRRAQTHCQNCLRQFRRTRAAVLVASFIRRIMLV